MKLPHMRSSRNTRIEGAFTVMDQKPRDLIKPYVLI